MKKEYIILIIAMIFGLLINLTSAESIGTFKQKEDIQLYQTCNNCTYCNFTSITYPNSSIILSNVVTTKDETYFSYNLDGGNTSVIGEYDYCYDCGNGIDRATGCLTFEINGTGQELTQQKSTLYVVLFGILILLFVVNLFVIPMLPSKNEYDEEGTLISITQLKYVRPILYVTAYLIFMSIMFISSNVSLAYLGTSLMGTFLFRIYQIMMALALPMVTFWFVFIVYNIFKDKEMKRYIERGLID